MLAWAPGSAYKGFHALPHDFSISTDRLFESQRLYYNPEGKQISLQFIRDYLHLRQDYYNNKKDNRDTLKKGVVFVIMTCLIDWFICSM